MTTTLTTRALAERLLERIGAGDPELYAERVDYLLNWPASEHGHSETPWIGPRSTRDDMAELNHQLAEHHVSGESDFRLETILADGDDAVVLGEIRQTAKTTGRAYRARYALHLTFEDGLVIRNHVYEDSLAVEQAFAHAS